MRLQQDQMWKKRNSFIRITRLERWEVAYKEMTDPTTKEGEHHVLPKKEFCRLIRGATLLDPAGKDTEPDDPETEESGEAQAAE